MARYQPTAASAQRGLFSAPSTIAASLPRAAPSPPPNPSASQARKGKQVDRWSGWTPIIGLELHVQLKGNVKLLSSAKAMYDAIPNSHVALFDAAFPGSLPRLQPEPVRLALLACLALKCDINPSSTFDRKHYFYPDLPAGFQVTQKYSPLAKGGRVRIRQEVDGEPHEFLVRIDQVQLEQDTAKSTHDPESGTTLVDLNRAGAALIEIVTEPDMRTPEEAAAFVRHLQSVLRHVGASDANMERGELRCDVNVSVHRTSVGQFGARCEVKNLNGIRFLVAAIVSEIRRQIGDLEAGLPVAQATRGFNAITGETFHLRSKEDAPDYRFMPDPELGPIIVTPSYLEKMRAGLPELPDEAFSRLQSHYGLTPRDAAVLVALEDGVGVAFFDQVAAGRDPRIVGNWVIHELLGQLAKAQIAFADSLLAPGDLGALVDAVASGQLTGTVAKSILASFLSTRSGATMTELIATEAASGLTAAGMQALCDQVIVDLPDEANKVRAGHTKVLMRLVGEAMKRSKGKGDAQAIARNLRSALGR